MGTTTSIMYPQTFNSQHVNSNLDESSDVKWLRTKLIKDFNSRKHFIYHGYKQDINNPVLITSLNSKYLKQMPLADLDKVMDEIVNKGFTVYVTFRKNMVFESKKNYTIEYSKYKTYKYRNETMINTISAYYILNHE